MLYRSYCGGRGAGVVTVDVGIEDPIAVANLHDERLVPAREGAGLFVIDDIAEPRSDLLLPVEDTNEQGVILEGGVLREANGLSEEGCLRWYPVRGVGSDHNQNDGQPYANSSNLAFPQCFLLIHTSSEAGGIF